MKRACWRCRHFVHDWEHPGGGVCTERPRGCGKKGVCEKYVEVPV